MKLRVISLLVLAAGMTAASGGARSSEQPAAAADPAPTQPGLLCAWARTSAAAEMGRRCRAGQNPALQAELERSAARFEAHARTAGMPADMVETFRAGPAMMGASVADLCTGDPVRFYEGYLQTGPEALKADTDRLIAQPGQPGWGRCR